MCLSLVAQISLGTIVARVSQAFFKAGIERNRIQRHLDVDRRRELRPYAAHALARGSLALRRLALDYQNIFAAGGREVVGDAGGNNASADEDDVCGLHDAFALTLGRCGGKSDKAQRGEDIPAKHNGECRAAFHLRDVSDSDRKQNQDPESDDVECGE